MQLNKIKTSAKNQTEAAFRMNVKIFNGKKLPHKLLLTVRQTAKIKKVIENNMSTNIKLSKT